MNYMWTGKYQIVRLLVPAVGMVGVVQGTPVFVAF